MSVLNQQTLFRTIIRCHKKDSAFIYFILESNEGLCFFSTLDHEVGSMTRDIEIICTEEFTEAVLDILDKFRKDGIEYETLVSETRIDGE